MQTKTHNDYLSPELEVLHVEVEQGFSISNMEQIGGEKPEQNW